MIKKYMSLINISQHYLCIAIQTFKNLTRIYAQFSDFLKNDKTYAWIQSKSGAFLAFGEEQLYSTFTRRVQFKI